MEQTVLTVRENARIARDVYRMVLAGNAAAARPGQFVQLKIPGFYLRRPISVCDADGEALTLIYKTVGDGTRAMADMRPDETLDVLTGLGNGYDLSRAGDRPLLAGGGVGVPPLYLLAKTLREKGLAVQVLLGFNTSDEVFYEEEFRKLGCGVTVTTVDGSHGVKGFVTDALPENYSYFYACGPKPMLTALCAKTVTDGEVSLEERMGCGFGACMGCAVKTRDGAKRVCRDGPVFRKSELEW